MPVTAQPRPEVTACTCGNQLGPDSAFCNRCGAKAGAAPPQWRLSCHSPTHHRTVPLRTDDMKIGAATECDLALTDDAYVSRQHARVTIRDGQLFIEDANSSNGTFIRIRQPVRLEAGDEIVVGSTLLRVEQS